MLSRRNRAFLICTFLILGFIAGGPSGTGARIALATIENSNGFENPGGTTPDSEKAVTGTGDDSGSNDTGGTGETGEGSEYTVVSGDTLWDIAARFYGDGGRWIEIFKANLGSIANPNLIFPGQIFVIPGITGILGTPGSSSSASNSSANPSATPPKPDASGAIVMNVPHLYQGSNPRMPWSTCGPTSLAMVMRYFGKNVTADELIGPTGCTEAEGTYLGMLATAGKKYGFPGAYTGNFDLAWLDKQLAAGNPVITNVKLKLSGGGWGGHYMVVIGIDAQGNYICNDPAKPGGHVTFTRQYLWEVWKGHHNAAACVLK